MSQHPDIARWTSAEEGPFFERKSAFDRSSARAKQRKAADIARDIAETLTAMANADGGELLIGMENDGALTGVPHAEDKIRLLLGAPKDRNYVSPPLTAMGTMRELGEGVPRMFDEMERAGCYPPRFEAIGGAVVQVTLRNEPIYDRDTLEWLSKFKAVELSGDQKRMLAHAHAHGDRFTSRDCQTLLGTDIYGASTAIKDMIRKGVARSPETRSRIYLVQQPVAAHTDMPVGFANLLPVLQRNGGIRNEDVRRTLAVNRIAATRYLRDLTGAGWLIKPDKRGLGALYVAGPRLLHQSQTGANGRETDAMGTETDAMKS